MIEFKVVCIKHSNEELTAELDYPNIIKVVPCLKCEEEANIRARQFLETQIIDKAEELQTLIKGDGE